MLGANVVAQSSTASSTAPGQTHIFSVGAVCTGFSFIETYTDVRQNGKTFTPNKLDIPVGDIAGRFTPLNSTKLANSIYRVPILSTKSFGRKGRVRA